MSDFPPVPNIKNVFKVPDFDFTFIVYAYKKISQSEAKTLYYQYLSENKLKHPPKGQTIETFALHGFDAQ